MVFSSVPVYLDPPNWLQQPGGVLDENPQLPPPMPPPPSVGGGGSTGSIRPGSLSERARLRKLPKPETALNCPRCESTNTKFCYFNNYSLSQPRYFCKTCRRYWTRGGALRNVPVGGVCRRNKKSKESSRSKSPVCCSSTSAISSNSCTTDINIIGHLAPPPPQFPFLPSLHHLSDYGAAGDIGLSFGGIQPPAAAVTAGATGMYQFPLLAGLEAPAGMYQFQISEGGVEPSNYVGEASQLSKTVLDCGLISQIGAVKFEENQGLSLSKNFLGIPGNDQQYWSGNAWTDLNGFTSSSASHLL